MPRRKAFTLVELLIVVVMLGLLAAIVLPKFSNATATARATMLADDLRILRTQVQIYRSQHREVSPAYVGGDPNSKPTEDAFIAAMTQASKPTGETAAPGTAGYDYGPYVSEMPPNPLNGKATVQIIANDEVFPAAGDDTHGWIFKPQTLLVKADSPGADERGTAYFDY